VFVPSIEPAESPPIRIRPSALGGSAGSQVRDGRQTGSRPPRDLRVEPSAQSPDRPALDPIIVDPREAAATVSIGPGLAPAASPGDAKDHPIAGEYALAQNDPDCPAAEPTTEARNDAGNTSILAGAAPSEPGSIGKIGRFVLRSVLGRGSFGLVYRAYDPLLDREIALKVPRIAGGDPREAARFLAEAKAAARLRHPNIVAVYESGQDGDIYYIASEYVDGHPLSARLAERAPKVPEAVAWVRDLALALNYAHDEGVIHRDIKPANIMIDQKNRAQLMDFGLAKRIRDSSAASLSLSIAEGSIVGTPAYMSPEQARGDRRAVGPASDQYSLGVVLYELLIRRRPFEGEVHVVLQQVIRDAPPRPRSARPDLSTDLEAVCLKAMEKDPERRYEDLAQFARDLDNWLAGLAVRARRIGPIGRLERWARRQPALAAATGLTTAALGLAIVMLAVSFSAHSQRRIADALRIAAEERNKAAEARADADRRRVAETQAQVKRNETQKRREQAVRLHAQSDLLGALPPMLGALDLALEISDEALQQECLKDLIDWRHELIRVRSIIEMSPWDPKRIDHASQENVPPLFRPDGRVVLTQDAESGGELRLWNVSTGEGIGDSIEAGRKTRLGAAAFSRNSRRIATGGVAGVHDADLEKHPEAKEARVWDAETGKPIGPVIHHPARVTALLLADDGRVLVTGGPDLPLSWWDAASGRPIGERHPGTEKLAAMALSPDGKTLFTSHAAQQVRQTAAALDALNRLLGGNLPDSFQDVVRPKPLILRFDAATGGAAGNPVALLGTDGRPSGGFLAQSLTFSADGRYVLASDPEVTYVIDVQTNTKLGPALPYQTKAGSSTVGVMDRVGFGPKGPVVLRRQAHTDFGYTIRLHDAVSGKEIGPPIVSPQANVFRMALSPNGRTLLTAWAKEVTYSNNSRTDLAKLQLYDGVTGRSIGREIVSAGEFFSPDGGVIAVLPKGPSKADRTYYQLYSARTGRPLGQSLSMSDVEIWNYAARPPRRERLWSPVDIAAFSPDGATFLLGRKNALWLFDAVQRRPTDEPLDHADRVRTIAFRPSGRELLTLDDFRATLRRWDAVTGDLLETVQRVFDHHAYHDTPLLFSPDGTRLFTAERASFGASGGATVANAWLRDAATGKLIGNPLKLEGGVLSAAFSADSRALVMATGRTFGAQGPTNCLLLNARDGRILAEPFYGGSARIATVALSPDARTIYASDDTFDRYAPRTMPTLRSTADGKPLGRPIAEAERANGKFRLGGAKFRPDGRYVATIFFYDTHSGIRYWDAATGEAADYELSIEHISAMEFSPDSRVLVTGSSDGVVQAFDATSPVPLGREIRLGGGVAALAFSPTGDAFAVAVSTQSRSEVRLFPAPVPMRPDQARAALGRDIGYNLNNGVFAHTEPSHWRAQ
jgi:WD40 repeat protein